jgi:hypothetical protein
MSRSEAGHLLFILGAAKTATTTLCGLLNSHPDVFVMCEVFLNNSQISRYGGKLLKARPEFLSCFFRPYGADLLANYRKAHEMMRAQGHAARYFGDKFVGIDSGFVESYMDTRVIYCVRRLPEWIAKDSIRGLFPLQADVVPFATQYAKHFIESFLLPRIHHIRMEEFLQRNTDVVRDVWRFLELDPPSNAERWWETIGHYPEGDPKAALNWWRGHASSAVAPQENDTKVEIRPNPFWQEIMPIFNKYYNGVGTRRFTAHEVKADLAQLQTMIGRHHQPFENCFILADSRSHNFRLKNKRGKRNGRWRSKIGKILQTIGIRD